MKFLRDMDSTTLILILLGVITVLGLTVFYFNGIPK